MASFTELSVSLVEPVAEPLLDRFVQQSMSRAEHSIHAFKLVGWVVGRRAPVSRVELVQDGTVLQGAPVDSDRPKIGTQFPETPWAARSGWQVLVDPFAFDKTIDAELRAVFADGTVATLAAVRGLRQPLPAAAADLLQPLVVTALGRSGTTWLMRLIAEHPAIVAYRRYPYEVRPGLYWTHVLRVLSGRADYSKPTSHPNTFFADRSVVGASPYHTATLDDYPELQEWTSQGYVDRLAEFCHGSIETWYRCLAAQQDQPDPVYFAEKHLPNEYPILLREMYPGMRELFLVRDFRDVATSVLAFNAQRGFDGFGRQRVESDEAFLQQFRRDVANLLMHWRRRSDRAHLVRYEDLITKPEVVLPTLLAYLELDNSAATVNAMLERADLETPELSQHQTSESPAASIGRWRRDLHPSLHPVAAAAFDDLLEAFGYDPNA